MMHVKNILVPVDFSEYSKVALRYGLELARKLDAAVTVLHINWIPAAYVGLDVMMPTLPEGGQTIQDYTHAQAQEHLAALVDEVAKPDGPVIHREVRAGDAAKGIIDRAGEDDVDMIVMGTHGRSGLDHWLIGSIAEKVVRSAPCPVLTVRYHPKAE